MFDRHIIHQSELTCDRAHRLMERSENLCRESRWLIEASKGLLGDLDDFLKEFDSQMERDAP